MSNTMEAYNQIPEKNAKKPILLKRYLLVLLVIIAIIASLVFVKTKQFKALGEMAKMPVPPTNVTAVKSTAEAWKKQIKAVGSLKSSQGVDITSEVTGVIKKIHVQSGDLVEKGQILFEIDSAGEVAALSAAQSNYNALLKQYERSLTLLKSKNISQNEIDLLEANVKNAKAQIDVAQNALDKKVIRAPFSGVLGLRLVDEGSFVSFGQVLINLQAFEKLFIDFSVPEKNIAELEKGGRVSFTVSAFKSKVFEGVVQAWSAKVDSDTRTINVRAEIDNADKLLVPGMFADINLDSKESQNVIIVPETSIFYNVYGEAVFVLESKEALDENDQVKEADEKSASQPEYVISAKQVDVLFRRDGYAAISQGVESDVYVVTSGQSKLYPSLNVVIVDDIVTSENMDTGQAKQSNK